MSRSGYHEDYDSQWQLICWRGAVNSAMNGQRGQAFFRDMLKALDELPEPKLVAHHLEKYDGATDTNLVCAIGAVGRMRGIDMTGIDPEDSSTVAYKFDISDALAREIVYMNDEWGPSKETDTERYYRMRRWIKACIRGPVIEEDENGRWFDDGGRH